MTAQPGAGLVGSGPAAQCRRRAARAAAKGSRRTRRALATRCSSPPYTRSGPQPSPCPALPCPCWRSCLYNYIQAPLEGPGTANLELLDD